MLNYLITEPYCILKDLVRFNIQIVFDKSSTELTENDKNYDKVK